MNEKVEKILRLYRIYLWLNLGFYGCAGFLGAFAVTLPRLSEFGQDLESVSGVLTGGGVFLILFSLFFGLTIVAVLREDVRKRNWLFHYICICAGGSSIIFTPFSFKLAKQWNSVEVKNYFNSPRFDL